MMPDAVDDLWLPSVRADEEDARTEDRAGRLRSPSRSRALSEDHDLAPLLVPLVRAQDAAARLEAALEAASPDVQQGLRARISLTETSGWLAYRHAAPVHPRDLALREAGLTGSYTLAVLTGGTAREMPHSSVAADGPAALEHVPQDWAVTQALHYARLWRRLAALATWRPLRDPATLGEALAQLGGPGLDAEALAAWSRALRRAGRDRPGLIAAGEVMDAGLPLGQESEQGRGRRLNLACGFVAACLWRDRGFGVPISLPFWSAPLSRLDALARAGGTAFLPAYLECVAEAALRARRDLARLQAAEQRIAGLAGTARSRLWDAANHAVREPVVTAAGLARGLGVAPRSALDLINRLVNAGVLEESTGRAAWRAYTLVGA